MPSWPLDSHLDVRDELLTAWDRDGYHDLEHLAEVLDRLALLGVTDPVVLLAAWFHDAVYEGERDDEERSAEWALSALPPELGPEVERLVRMTATHDPAPDDPGACALSDADLGILAAPPERYAAYVAGVRRDYAHVADEDFRAGRVTVLEDLLERPQLFRLPQARELWEDAARDNLARELESLR
jgi:predicted metal-dependent HD superfamily phosphohydrolase